MEVKTYRITGYMIFPWEKVKFSIERKGTSPEDVVELVFSELGSRHKLKRDRIRICSVEEVEKKEEVE